MISPRDLAMTQKLDSLQMTLSFSKPLGVPRFKNTSKRLKHSPNLGKDLKNGISS
jgi:hypothetical protein